jgi:hypothetical protein
MCDHELMAMGRISIAAVFELSCMLWWLLSELCGGSQGLLRLLRAACARLGPTGQGQVGLLCT